MNKRDPLCSAIILTSVTFLHEHGDAAHKCASLKEHWEVQHCLHDSNRAAQHYLNESKLGSTHCLHESNRAAQHCLHESNQAAQH